MDPYKNIKSKIRENVVSNHIDFLQNKLFMEFGVHSGASLLEFYELYNKYKISKNFFGFDSFLGLPVETVDKHSPWKQGKFSCGGNINPDLLNKSDVNIYKGWFSETLFNNSNLLNQIGNKKVGIAHIDCDIYTSTVHVFDFLFTNNLLCNGSILIYDDWGSFLMNDKKEYENGQSKAHVDIQKKYNVNFEFVDKIIIDPSFYIITIYKVNE